jgi:Ca-activated chloride channel family protein
MNTHPGDKCAARSSRRQLNPLLLLVCAAGIGLGAGEASARWSHQSSADTEPPAAEAPYFILTDKNDRLEQFPLKSTEVDAVISGAIADVTVKQTYQNTGQTPIEAVYVFPASTGAAVHGLEMRVEDRLIKAVIEERTEAARKYETAKTEGRSASLLEQNRPNVFQMSVANIMPGETIDVTLRYTEILQPEEKIYSFVFPTVVGPRYGGSDATPGGKPSNPWIANPTLPEGTASPSGFSINVRVHGGMPIAHLRSPSHQIEARFSDPTEAQVNLRSDSAPGNDRDFILEYQLAGKQVATGLLLHDGTEEQSGYFLVTAQPPARVRKQEIPPREYIFIVDVSGSMSGFPLNTAKELMKQLGSTLRERDRFNLVLFASDSRQLAPSPVPATRENIRAAMELLNDESGRGGTELTQALQKTFASLPEDSGISRSILIVTDGYISFEGRAFELVRKSLGKANLFAFGIGSSVNRHLIEGLARAGMGEPFIVTNSSEAKKTAERFADYVSSPVLTDVRVTFDGFGAFDVDPESIPDVLADRPILVAGRWNGEPAGSIVIEGNTSQGAFRQVLHVADAAAQRHNPALEYLWARRRIATLGDLHEVDPNSDTASEITRLGLTHHLLTKFTSFVAVDTIVRNKEGGLDTVQQPLPLPAGVSASAIGSSVPITPEPGMAGLAAIVGGTLLMLRRRMGARH